MSEPSNTTLGVICARFQVADLHDGHKWLINEVAKRHKHVLILLGTTIVKNSPRNPLTFNDRKAMLMQSELGDYALEVETAIYIKEIKDHSSDITWSNQMDAIVKPLLSLLEPGDNWSDNETPSPCAVLYGARDSAIPHYKGIYSTHQFEQPAGMDFSGTEVRKALCGNPPHTSDYRMGRIIQAADRYPINYMCVDAIIYNPQKQEVLLGRKPGEDKFRFIGGFSDPTDDTLESAAIREAGEEVIIVNENKEERPITIEYAHYFTSLRIDDSRYRSEPDKIMSAVVICYTSDYVGIEGADDIEEVKWIPALELVNENIMTPHKVIVEALVKSWPPVMNSNTWFQHLAMAEAFVTEG